MRTRSEYEKYINQAIIAALAVLMIGIGLGVAIGSVIFQ